LGRALPAVLYSGTNYVQAQRERRLMLAEMASIYDRYDVLVTPTAPGPAPRLGTWRTISFWQNSSLTTPFNVTAGPALAQCMGFTPTGLPLSLQLAGRPFEEVTVLRAAHAYETATNWRNRRPSLDPGATFSTELPPTIRPEPVSDPEVREIVVAACRRAELSLNDSQIDMIGGTLRHGHDAAPPAGARFPRGTGQHLPIPSLTAARGISHGMVFGCCVRKCCTISQPVARQTPAWEQMYWSAESRAPIRCGWPVTKG
jgi:hypothetical protein